MTRRPRGAVAAPGQDSFLDIVANLVGILIILVMVVGVRAKDALQQAARAEPAAAEASEPEPEAAPELPPIDVDQPKAQAAAIEGDIQQLSEKLQRQQLEIDYRRRERDRIQLLISAAEKQLQQRRQELSNEQQRDLQLARQAAAAQAELERLRRQQAALTSSDLPVEKIDHLPTPMAKTVFGRELHFRLQDGRLAHVPWDELVAKLKQDAPKRIWKLKDAPRVTEVIGPLGGFRMQYTLKKEEQPVRTQNGAALQQQVVLDFFQLVPVQKDLGDPVDQALSGNSQFQNVIGSSDPKQTTVTIWVYPNSFDDFRRIKQWLFERGYLTASRPMPEGRLMGGSPQGTRSASQ